MINVLEKVKEQKDLEIQYADEKIASNIYLISLSNSLRSLDGRTEKARKKAIEKNDWIYSICPKIKEIPVLDFDNIKNLLKIEMTSCDGLFYNYAPCKEEQHYLIELKNVKKKKLLKMMDSKDKDAIICKVNDSIKIILNFLEFGGIHENNVLISNTHFIIVYEGKNDIPAQNPRILLPGKQKINDKSGIKKQDKASKMDYCSRKEEYAIYKTFGEEIAKLGLQGCDEDVFPGEALPKAKKQGKRKYRDFSIFSARDFAEVVDNGFFDNWNWGEYQKYF